MAASGAGECVSSSLSCGLNDITVSQTSQCPTAAPTPAPTPPPSPDTTANRKYIDVVLFVNVVLN